jgi:hypothetical protein
MFKDTGTPFSALFADFNSSHPGNEVIVAGLSNDTTMLWGHGTTWNKKLLWRAPGGLEGIAYGDYDQSHDGKELCIAGYSRTAVLLYETTDYWYNEIIYNDPDPLLTELNGVLIIDYTTDPGLELIIIGSTGNIRSLTYQPPGFDLTSPSYSKNVTAGEFTTFQINLLQFSGYSSNVTLELTGIPQSVTYDISRSSLIPGDDDPGTNSAVLTIETTRQSIPDIYQITVQGTGVEDNIEKQLSLSLEVLPPPLEPDFKLSYSPQKQTVNLSHGKFSIEFEIKILPIDGFDQNVSLIIDDSYLNSPDIINKIDVFISPNRIDPTGTAILNITIAKDLEASQSFIIPLKAQNDGLDLQDNASLELEVIYYKKPRVNGDGSDDGTMHQWVGVILMTIVVIVLVVFMVKRMREITRQEQKRRNELLEQRAKQGRNRGRSGGPGRR